MSTRNSFLIQRLKIEKKRKRQNQEQISKQERVKQLLKFQRLQIQKYMLINVNTERGHKHLKPLHT